jgi:hypothetical protein
VRHSGAVLLFQQVGIPAHLVEIESPTSSGALYLSTFGLKPSATLQGNMFLEGSTFRSREWDSSKTHLIEVRCDEVGLDSSGSGCGAVVNSTVNLWVH